jgi:F-type H+-transporting ATPase subunit a
MEHEFWVTALLNQLFGGPVTSLLQAIGIHPESPSQPIPNSLAMEIVVALFIVVLLGWLRAGLSVERPGRIQHLMELLFEGIETQSEEIIGHGGKQFVPILFTLGLFIFLCNALGTIPIFETPTDQITVTVGCALVAFTYYNFWGIRHHGIVGYGKTFLGPVWWLAPLMLIIELISHLARALSLSVRLYANMLAGHRITLVFFSLIPVVVPALFGVLHIAVGALQAYIFVLLTTIYLSGAVSEGH